MNARICACGCGDLLYGMRSDAVYRSEACKKRAQRASSGDKAGTVHPLDEARGQMREGRTSAQWELVAREKVARTLLETGEFTADALADLNIPVDYRRHIHGAATGYFAGAEPFMDFVGRQKSARPSRKGGKNDLYAINAKGRRELPKLLRDLRSELHTLVGSSKKYGRLPIERLLDAVEENEVGCWVLQRYISTHGYGRIEVGNRAEKKKRTAHLITYEEFVGSIPPGLVLDHLCRNRACINPGHLEAVTEQENILRGEGVAPRNAEKTHCPQGHSYSGDNLHITPAGVRHCRTCRREAERRRQERIRHAAASNQNENVGVDADHHGDGEGAVHLPAPAVGVDPGDLTLTAGQVSGKRDQGRAHSSSAAGSETPDPSEVLQLEIPQESGSSAYGVVVEDAA